jgi:hypothetical protein
MPPFAIVFGPGDVPLGENGCCASATRSLPSAPVYRCANGVAAKRKSAAAAAAVVARRVDIVVTPTAAFRIRSA